MIKGFPEENYDCEDEEQIFLHSELLIFVLHNLWSAFIFIMKQILSGTEDLFGFYMLCRWSRRTDRMR
ncbi:hypothetical protein OPV22_020113 [Ensete ventricosum]|uniref:Uncharacterized protein n=1 Tax=Ensete ventricosum TaxID=4639 RepID=A0AAV8PBT0_ENSVE|nr:hypothetical protein OPV22_020113 [Ensete ventricosum]